MSGNVSLRINRYKPAMGERQPRVPEQPSVPSHSAPCEPWALQGAESPRRAAAPDPTCRRSPTRAPRLLLTALNPQSPPRASDRALPSRGDASSPPLSTSPHWSTGLSPAPPCPHRDTRLLDTGTMLCPRLKLNSVLGKHSLGYTGEVFCTPVVRGLT